MSSPDGFFQDSLMTAARRPLPLVAKCGICGLAKQCKSPKMEVSGSGRKGVMIVGEAPGKDEDDKGIQFVGRTGQFLQKILRYIGVDMRRDCWVHNALSCRPGKDNVIRDPKAIDYCRPRVIDSIKKFDPTVIILLGKSAVASVIGHVWKENVGGSKTWAGWKIPSRDPNAWIMPTYHPSYVAREKNREAELYARTYQRHLQAAFDLAGTRPWNDDVPDEEKEVEIVYEPDTAAGIIRDFATRGGWVAFDYESDRLKPDSKQRRIVACGVCWRGKRTIAFPWRGEAINAMKELLASPMPKIAHNLQFEKRWTERALGIQVGGWNVEEGKGWDTMNAAHVLDCRKGINSLKFQSFVRLGFPDYDSRIKPYLGSKGEGGNARNRIDEIDMPSLLKYVGLDALLTYRIAMQQRKEFGYGK